MGETTILLVRHGERVQAGQPLVRVHHNRPAEPVLPEIQSAIGIEDAAPKTGPFVIDTLSA